MMPSADIAFLADRKNAPYGAKSRERIIAIAERNIELLRGHGASTVLIACCTASTVYGDLSDGMRRSVIPIISETARRAALASANGRIGVLATAATVGSRAFDESVRSFRNEASVVSRASPSLVEAIERYGTADDALLDSELAYLGEGIDTVILGCTHFAALEEKIRKRGYLTVNSARVGADMLAERAECGRGVTLYINE
jgi:glutamate racemase